ncbi:MAG TPA: PEP-CTERM sorting domain-containing protein [Chthoniobacterales bacterium]
MSPVNAAQVPVDVAGFNQDLVVGTGTAVNPAAFQTAITASMDGGTTKSGSTWYQLGENADAPATGLPMGATFTSASDPGTSFAFQSDAGNNAILIDSAHTTGNFTLTTPSTFSSLSLLASSAVGPTTVNITLQFTDSTVLSLGNFVIQDWFSTSTPAIIANGRIWSGGFEFVNSGNPRMFQIDVSLTGAGLTKVISGLSFTDVNDTGGRAGIFALSGTAIPEPGETILLTAGALTGWLVLRRRAFFR